MTYLADRKPGRRGALSRVWRDEAGFSLLELILIGTIASTMMAIAIFGLGTSISAARARGAIAQVKVQLSNARELAISQQRDIRVEITDPNQIRVVRINRGVEEGEDEETELSSVNLEGGMIFEKVEDSPETPDAWGGAGPIAFGGAEETIRFRAGDGALVDDTGASVNGRVFVSHANGKRESAGVVSIFGPTGRIRSYRLTGDTWD